MTQEPTQSHLLTTKSIPAAQKIPRDLGSRVKNHKLELKMLPLLFSRRKLWGFRSPVPGTGGRGQHDLTPTVKRLMDTGCGQIGKKRYKWKYKTNDKMFHLFIRREMKI